MKTFESKSHDRKFKIEEFENVLEMTRANQKRVVNECWESDAVRKGNLGDEDFYGVKTYNEAYELLAGGWELGTKKIASLIDKVAKSGTKSKTSFYNDVYGFIPNVPLALLNVPNSMINTRRTQLKSKVVTLIYNNSATCNHTSEEMIQAGKNVVEAVVNLEMSGYRVNVKVLSSFYDRSQKRADLALVNVKKDNQSLNLLKMMFPIAHSAWFRVIGFDWQDKSPVTKDHWISCRGTSLENMFDTENLDKSMMDEVLGENTIFVDYMTAKQGATAIEDLLKQKKIK